MRTMAYVLRVVLLCVLADFVISAIINGTHDPSPLNQVNTTGELKSKASSLKVRRKGSDRSTSSSSTEKKGSKDKDNKSTSGLSLELSLTESSESERGKKKKSKSYKPKSSNERSGWKKWHRKCQQCPDDMRLKWRDPNIKWICAAYQRARRSFKSLCMMHYRNCQDGTMFTKISDHRCPNASDILRHGEHFFYDYKVSLSIDSSKTSSSSSSSSDSSSSESRSVHSDKLESLENAKISELALRQNKV